MSPVPVLALSKTELPVQMLVEPPAVMLAVGSAFTVTVVFADEAEHPVELVTTTL